MNALPPVKFLAGVARIDITPTVPVSLGGYGQRAGLLSQGVHDPLSATALYLQSSLSRLLLITADLVALPDGLAARVQQGLQSAGVAQPGQVCLAASHTHSGPDVDESLVIAAPNRAYLDELVARLVQVGIAAASNPQPARLKTAIGQADFLVNRRQRGPQGAVDRRVLAVQLDAADSGQPLAVLFGVGCHAVCLGHDNLLLSADYPGYARQALEARFSPALALFVNLAEGNVIPATRLLYDSLDTRGYLGGDFDHAAQVGKDLADSVTAALVSAPPGQEAPGFLVAAQELAVLPAHAGQSLWSSLRELLQQRRIILEYLPEFRRATPFNLAPVFTLWRDASATVIERQMDESEMRRLMSAVSRFLVQAMRLGNPAFRRPQRLPVQVIQLGPLRLLALPGEALVEVAQDWQQRNLPHSEQAFVIGLANGFRGYLPHPDNFREPEAELKYETIMNALEPEATRRMLDLAARLLPAPA